MGCLATAPDLLDEPNVEKSPDLSFSDRAASGPTDSSLIDLPLWYAALVAPAVRVEPSPPKPRTGLFWRPIVARWSLDRRQFWGDRANELQDAGFDWKEAERVAYEEIIEDLKPASR
jgi:hypothetical protein